MNFDIALVLVVLTVVSGFIWLLDSLVFKPKRLPVQDNAADGKEPLLVEYAKSLFPIFLIVLVLRSFIFEPFRIPSQSMMPTLLVGDFILVNKFSYGLRWPVLNSTFLETGDPQRGDVIVFRFPENPSINYIKRVIGLPGDVIEYRGKMLTINGEPIRQQRLGSYQGYGSGSDMTGAMLKKEQLGDVEHDILIRPRAFSLIVDNGRYVVPEGHYFVMGDNRDNSNDSRVWGFVPEENLVGKAFVIWFNWDVGEGFSWQRIGDTIK